MEYLRNFNSGPLLGPCELGTGKKTSIDYFLPLLNPDQTSEERTFEEDIEMRADDVNEGFKDEERGQLRKSRVEVAENHILRKNR